MHDSTIFSFDTSGLKYNIPAKYNINPAALISAFDGMELCRLAIKIPLVHPTEAHILLKEALEDRLKRNPFIENLRVNNEQEELLIYLGYMLKEITEIETIYIVEATFDELEYHTKELTNGFEQISATSTTDMDAIAASRERTSV